VGRVGGTLSIGSEEDGEKMKRYRKAAVRRKTKETEVVLKLNLDGSGNHSIQTGIPFFDHMLSLLAYHSRMDLSLKAKGDIGVDAHHTVEDVASVWGMGLERLLAKQKESKIWHGHDSNG